jgi:hypothetical protein
VVFRVVTPCSDMVDLENIAACIFSEKWVRQNRSHFATDGQSVRLGDELPLRESRPYFSCSQDSCGFVCHGASSVERMGLFCNRCLCQAIYTYVHFCLFFKLFNFLNILYTWCLRMHQASQSRFCTADYEGVTKSFRTGRLVRELQMVQLSATRCNCIAILWASLVSIAAITLCIASQRVFVVYFGNDSVRKLLDTPSYA